MVDVLREVNEEVLEDLGYHLQTGSHGVFIFESSVRSPPFHRLENAQS